MPLQKPKAILFDWDDTLVNTGDVVKAAINQTLIAMGAKPWSEEEARERIGPPARVLFTGLFGEAHWQEADRIYLQAYEEGIAQNLRMHDLVPEILDELRTADVPLAVVSAKRGGLLRKEADHLQLSSRFLRIVGAGDAANDKPHQDAVLLALSGSGIAPGPDVWFLGDSLTDLQAAKNAGCAGVLIETKPPPEDKIAEIPPLLRFKNHAALLDHIKRFF